MKHLRIIAGGVLAAATLLGTATVLAAPGWTACHDRDCPPTYLLVTTRQGDAQLAVTRSCQSDWRHEMGRNDARRTIRQWFEGEAKTAFARLCIRLPSHVDGIEIVSLGGDCGGGLSPDIPSSISRPGEDVTFRRGSFGRFDGPALARLAGCHARLGNDEVGTVSFGGIFLAFEDGYGFGDSYADGYFYGVYDGFREGRVRPFRAGLTALSEHNTYHYAIRITASGRDNWWRHQENDR